MRVCGGPSGIVVDCILFQGDLTFGSTTGVSVGGVVEVGGDWGGVGSRSRRRGGLGGGWARGGRRRSRQRGSGICSVRLDHVWTKHDRNSSERESYSQRSVMVVTRVEREPVQSFDIQCRLRRGFLDVIQSSLFDGRLAIRFCMFFTTTGVYQRV